ncbi:thioredoxin family protein [bacterium]|nr:thioredoxin family protein [bacterium]
MSEEQTKTAVIKNSDKNVIIFLTILSLIFSIAALTVSTYQMVGTTQSSTEEKKVVISKQYDKGQTFAKAQAKNKPIIVFFYTDWCGFCQRFVPTFDKVAKNKKIKKKFAIAYVNCEKQENQAIMQEYGVQGFPTVFVINEFGEKTQLDNNTFFNDDSKDVLVNKALEIIEESKKD